MEKDNLKDVFEGLKGTFDTEEPRIGHQERFITKLNNVDQELAFEPRKVNWWKPLSIAASIAVLCLLTIGLFNSGKDIDQQVAQISPEVSNTQVYFASLIEDQIKQLESESSPETQKIIADTMVQLRKLEDNYAQLESDLINGGNDKMLLRAMITNFQTRIDLLQDVIDQIEAIKNLKNYNDENFTI